MALGAEEPLPSLVNRLSQYAHLLPPYPLSERTYLNAEVAYAPIRYLPGKAVSLLNWESILIGLTFPKEASPIEAQGYLGVGSKTLFGEDSIGETGITFNDLRGFHVNFLMRHWIFQNPGGWGQLRLATSAQIALPSWGTQGFSSASLFPRWEVPAGDALALLHLGVTWNGANRSGFDQEDEAYWGAGIRFPKDADVSWHMIVGGFTTASMSRAYFAPSLIWKLGSLGLMIGGALDLSPSTAHMIHIGLHAYGEPK